MRALTRSLLIALLVATAGSAQAGDLQTDGQLVTTETDGPPLAVSATAAVDGLHADRLDGLEGSSLPRSPDNVVTVGLTGANFSSVKDAVDSITDSSPSNPYLIRIGPGTFDATVEEIVLPSHIHLQGAGRDKTVIGASLRIEFFTRIVSLRIDGPVSGSYAVKVTGGAEAFFREVQLTHESLGLSVSSASNVEMVDSSIAVDGIDDRNRTGIFATTSHLRLRSVTIDVQDSGGLFTGNDATGITSRCGSISCPQGTLWATDLSIVASDGADKTKGIETDNLASVRILDSTISVTPRQDSNFGRAVEIIDPGPTLIARSTIVAHEVEPVRALFIGGVASEEVKVLNSRLEVVGSSTTLRTFSSVDINIFHSEVLGDGTLLHHGGTEGEVRAVHSHLAGGSVTGSVVCRWVTDEGFGTSSTSCP